jgi:hypothetical protein
MGLTTGDLTVGQAALKAVQVKWSNMREYFENQHVFIHFAFDTFDFLTPKTVSVLKRVQRVMHSNVRSHKSQDAVFKKIDFVIQKRLTAQLVVRLPSIKM